MSAEKVITVRYEFPKNLQHPTIQTCMTAAYLLEYWARKGVIPQYAGLIQELHKAAGELR
jgi:hypothetical protein